MEQCNYFLDPESHNDLKHLLIITDNLDADVKDTAIRWLSWYVQTLNSHL